MHPAYVYYKSGDISTEKALQWLTSTLEEETAEIAACREAISMIVAEQPDQRVDIPGLPVMMITAPGTERTVSYNNKAIEQIRLRLMKSAKTDEELQVLSMIDDARSLSAPKSGGLRITQRKQRKG